MQLLYYTRITEHSDHSIQAYYLYYYNNDSVMLFELNTYYFHWCMHCVILYSKTIVTFPAFFRFNNWRIIDLNYIS